MRSSLKALACLGAASGATMRASRIHAPITYDDTSSVFVDEVDAPTAGEGEVVIRVLGSSVNPVDWKLAEQGVYAAPRPPCRRPASSSRAPRARGCGRRRGLGRRRPPGFIPARAAPARAEYVAAPEAASRKPDSLTRGRGRDAARGADAVPGDESRGRAGRRANVSVIVTSGDGGTGASACSSRRSSARAVRTCAAPEDVTAAALSTRRPRARRRRRRRVRRVPDGSVDVATTTTARTAPRRSRRALRPDGWYVFLAGKDGGLCEPPA